MMDVESERNGSEKVENHQKEKKKRKKTFTDRIDHKFQPNLPKHRHVDCCRMPNQEDIHTWILLRSNRSRKLDNWLGGQIFHRDEDSWVWILVVLSSCKSYWLENLKEKLRVETTIFSSFKKV